MRYDVSFGRLDTSARAAPGDAFRLAVLGDFSGRASKGVLETGAALAALKPIRVDVDNLDDVLTRLAPRIQIPLGDEGVVEIPVAAVDDFHPDQLAEALPLFEQLLDLRRSLQSRTDFDRAAKLLEPAAVEHDDAVRYHSASSWSCVTRIVVMPAWRWMCFTSTPSRLRS